MDALGDLIQTAIIQPIHSLQDLMVNPERSANVTID